MKSSEILNEIKRIAKEVLPKGGQLILYGSRARNEADCAVSLCRIELGCRRADKPYYLHKGQLEEDVIHSILQEC